jgi:hypothetical protein
MLHDSALSLQILKVANEKFIKIKDHGTTLTVADVVCAPADAVIVTVVCTAVGDVLNVNGVGTADRATVTAAGTVTSSG